MRWLLIVTVVCSLLLLWRACFRTAEAATGEFCFSFVLTLPSPLFFPAPASVSDRPLHSGGSCFALLLHQFGSHRDLIQSIIIVKSKEFMVEEGIRICPIGPDAEIDADTIQVSSLDP